MKKAFSLVELLVVIGIIAVLAGVLLATFGGGSESARAAQCLANMKNLANACQTYGVESDDHIYPRSFPDEGKVMKVQNGRPKITYRENKGWISWFSKGNYPNGSAQSSQSNPIIGFRSSDEEKSTYALTNGCLWKLVSRNRATYVCPSHGKQYGKETKPTWSYLMNEKFKWQEFGKLERADRVLLLSEIPFKSWHSWLPDGTGTSTDDDAVLQYPSTDGSGGTDSPGANNSSGSGHETLGANHVNGRNLFAHVAFADGHTEKLRIPYTGNIKNPQIDESQLKNLTGWLCTGTDVSFNGKQYQKMDN